MKKVVVFGTNDLSSLAWYSLEHDSEYDVVGFTVDAEFRNNDRLHGLDVCDFETVESNFPPDECLMIVPLGFRFINGLRAEKYEQSKVKGYRFANYVSSRASVWPDLELGENCMIYENAVVQPFCKIGNNVIIRSASHVSHHCTIGDHCFISASAAIAGMVTIENYSFIGVNATIRDKMTIAERNVIAAGAVVVNNTEPDGVYIGVPAKRANYTSDQMVNF